MKDDKKDKIYKGMNMNRENQKRWGIFATGILMLFVTMIIASTSGSKTSLYFFVWIMVSYYGYKGDLLSIKQLMKWLIFINLGILLLVLIFMSDSSISYLANSQMELLIGVLVMLIPKIILFFYSSSELETQINKPSLDEMTQSYSQSTYNNQKDSNSIQSKPIDTKQNVSRMGNAKNDTQPINENELWTFVADEFEKNRDKGLWTKCFVESNGDENKTKSAYFKERFQLLKQNTIDAQEKQNMLLAEYNKNKTIENAIKVGFYKVNELHGQTFFIFDNNQVAVQFGLEKYRLYDNMENAENSAYFYKKMGKHSFIGFIREIKVLL